MAIPRFVRTPEDLKAARHLLGLSADGLARMVRVEEGRTVRRWEAGERPIPGPVTVIMEAAMDYLREKIELSQQLDRLNSGAMTIGSWTPEEGNRDETDKSITTIEAAIRSLEDALVVLTRHPLAEGRAASKPVHWYTLLRMTPRFNPLEKDQWTLPGEISVEAALLYFEAETGFGDLILCDPDHPAAEFILQQRVSEMKQFKASQRVRPGELVDQFYVRRAERS